MSRRERGNEARDQREVLTSSLADKLKAAGFSAAEEVVKSQKREDEAKVSSVGSQGEGIVEIGNANQEAREALIENAEDTHERLVDVAQVSEGVEKTKEMNELEGRQEAMVLRVSQLSNNAEEVVFDVKGLSKLLEDEIAASGAVPKSLKSLQGYYDKGVKLFTDLAQKASEQSGKVAGAELTEESLDAQQENVRLLSLEIAALNKAYKAEAVPLIKKISKLDTSEMEGFVERVKFLNQTLFDHIDVLVKGYADVAVGNFEPVQAEAENVESATDEGERAEAEPSFGVKELFAETGEVSPVDVSEPGVLSNLPKETEPVVSTVVDEVHGPGETQIADKGETGTLVGDQEEMLRNAREGVGVVSDVTIGADDDSPQEEKEFGVVSGAEQKGENDAEIPVTFDIPEEDDLRDVALDVQAENKAQEEKMAKLAKEAEMPSSLKELFEEDEAAELDKPAPLVTPEVANREDVLELLDTEEDKEKREEEVMGLFDRFEVVTSISSEEIEDVVAKAGAILDEYKVNYGEDDTSKLHERFIKKLEELVEAAKLRKERMPAQVSPESNEALGLDEMREAAESLKVEPVEEDEWVDVPLEGAMAVAGAAAVGAMAEKRSEKKEVEREVSLREQIESLAPGDWHEAFAQGKFKKEHWEALTEDERKRFVELQQEIMEQEEGLAHLKEAKDAMERALRAEYGNQFEVSAKAQKYMREKAGQIAKIEALLNRSRREQEIIREKGIKRTEWLNHNPEIVKQAAETGEVGSLKGLPDAKSSWWQNHPKVRYATYGAGALAGAGMFAAAYVGYKFAKVVFRISPFKILEKLGSLTEGFFGFLDKVLVKGDPVGAVTDVAKGAEKQFDKLLAKEKGKLKKKDKPKKPGDDKIKYSSAG